jgi:hypothetical protein
MQRWFWVYITIFVLGFGLRLAIVDYGLPYIHDVDEPNFYMLANDWRGELDATWRNTWLTGYPPGYIWLYAQVLDGVDFILDLNIHTDMAIYVRIMRFVSLLMDMVTLAALMGMARWLGGNAAGAIAGGIYAVSAEIISFCILALPDSATVMWTSLSAAVAIHALRTKQWPPGLLATGLALIAIIFKYPVFPILLFPALFFVLYLYRERFRAIPVSLIALLLVGGVASWLLIVYGAADLNNAESVRARTQLLDSFLNLHQWKLTMNALIGTMGIASLIFAVIGIAGIGFYRKSGLRDWLGLTLGMVVVGLALLVIVPIYLSKHDYPVRYIWPSAVLFIGGASILVGHLLSKVSRTLWTVLAIVIAMVWGMPEAITTIQARNRPFTYGLAQVWFEENVPDESVLWVEDYRVYRALSRYEAGYSGYNNYGQLYAQDNIFEDSVDVVDYLFLEENDLAQIPDLNQYPLIKRIDNEGRNGASLYIYSTNKLANQQETAFIGQGVQLLLRGLTFQQEGRFITVQSYWQAPENVPPHDYSYTLYLSPIEDDSKIVFQQDAGLGHRRTSTWNDPQELIRGNIAPITLADDLAKGDYHLWLGIYYWEDGERLLLEDAAPFLLMGSVMIP